MILSGVWQVRYCFKRQPRLLSRTCAGRPDRAVCTTVTATRTFFGLRHWCLRIIQSTLGVILDSAQPNTSNEAASHFKIVYNILFGSLHKLGSIEVSHGSNRNGINTRLLPDTVSGNEKQKVHPV